MVINGETVFEFPAIALQPGDVVELHIAGGGGFGPPAERDPERIRRDVARGYLTPEGAREQYGE